MVAEHKDEEAIFKAAFKLKSPTERIAYLKRTCGNDADLLARVEALLKAYNEAGNFLESPPGIEGTLDAGPLSEGPGTKIGRYKLLQLIGEGGFGVVYMAQQEEPVRRCAERTWSVGRGSGGLWACKGNEAGGGA